MQTHHCCICTDAMESSYCGYATNFRAMYACMFISCQEFLRGHSLNEERLSIRIIDTYYNPWLFSLLRLPPLKISGEINIPAMPENCVHIRWISPGANPRQKSEIKSGGISERSDFPFESLPFKISRYQVSCTSIHKQG